VKQDAVPGFINENWFFATEVGTYRGQCAELCGVNHGFMPIVVKVVSQEDFEKWVTDHNKVTQSASRDDATTLDKARIVANLSPALAAPTSGV
jgi:cytochrome c oxidase subunit 2